MEVILLEKMQNLGDLGERVKVRPGYARNYLIPQGRAVLATPANLADFEARRAALEAQQAESLAAAQARAEALIGLVATIERKAGEEGRLFGSVGTQDIADAIAQAGVEVRKLEVRLPKGPLRELGEHEVEIHLHPDVDATIAVKIIPEA